MDETKIIYHIDEEQTPYLIKLSIPPGKVTLEDFKVALNKPNFKYFFKSNDEDFGVVKEEISDDAKVLPCFDGKVKAWLVTAEGSALSDNQSQDDRRNHETNSHKNHSEDNASANSGDRLPPLKNFKNLKKLARYNGQKKNIYDANSSVMSSDIETTSFLDSEDESTRFSTATGTTFSTRYAKYRRKVKKHKARKISKISEDESSFSSMTDSTMSLNIVSVTLQMDAVNFLGISIVGQSNKAGDGGIYVGSIMKDGAVARDGRIEPGDMILEVNNISFEDMSNDEAVIVLRKQVQIPGPITLVVAKCWDSNPKSYVCQQSEEPIKPVDPRAWVLHSNAFINGKNLSTVNSEIYMGNNGESILSSNQKSMNSDSMNDFDLSKSGTPQNNKNLSLSSYPQHLFTQTSGAKSISNSSNCDKKCTSQQIVPNALILQSINQLPSLLVSSDTHLILVAAQMPDSGLKIHDRVWLKIVIPNAFIGSELVSWLFSKVEGFSNRKEAKGYASDLLRYKHIRHVVNKDTFSEPCYYVFSQTVPDLISKNPATFGYYQVTDNSRNFNCDMTKNFSQLNIGMSESNGYSSAWPILTPKSEVGIENRDVLYHHYPLGVEGSKLSNNGFSGNAMQFQAEKMHLQQMQQHNNQMFIQTGQNNPQPQGQRLFNQHNDSMSYNSMQQPYYPSGSQNLNHARKANTSGSSSSSNSEAGIDTNVPQKRGLPLSQNHLTTPYSGPSISSNSNSSQVGRLN